MCGIFGVISPKINGFTALELKSVTTELFRLSESRGKEAAGFAFLRDDIIKVCKQPVPATCLIKSDSYQQLFKNLKDKKQNNYLKNSSDDNISAFLGHSRLVTNGGQQINNNNQPVIAEGMIAIHNGIITNVDKLWQQFPGLKKQYDIDTEILLALLGHHLQINGDLVAAVRYVFRLIEGVASVAVLFEDLDCILLATNNGSLYKCFDREHACYIFSSEKYILKTLLEKKYFRNKFDIANIKQIPSGVGCLINLHSFHVNYFSLVTDGLAHDSTVKITPSRKIKDISPLEYQGASAISFPGEGPYILPSSFVDKFPENRAAVNQLKRCSRCILPETMPFISFDKNRVCNFCHEYKKIEYLSIDTFVESIKPLRTGSGEPDCLIAFSGGRDSSFGVHYVKNVLGMNPITYTYDWGMITDLARRNQMRICGKLGIEHILVSADIRNKRENIKKNVTAWLKKPDLGTIPLFMAGDKQYFYYANKIGKQTGCKQIVLCENLLETTRFKSGFCGVPPFHKSSNTYSLSMLSKLQMALYYGQRFLTNPSYLNSSLFDTLQAFGCYYFIPHDYLNLYQYIKWDEEEINTTLIKDYNWETAVDTDSTWRIGDGTAAFYNYIYYTMAGLSENDTFRSNQIREGIITREEALMQSKRENAPRYESIQWYCDIIGIDFHETIKTINNAPKLYTK